MKKNEHTENLSCPRPCNLDLVAPASRCIASLLSDLGRAVNPQVLDPETWQPAPQSDAGRPIFADLRDNESGSMHVCMSPHAGNLQLSSVCQLLTVSTSPLSASQRWATPAALRAVVEAVIDKLILTGTMGHLLLGHHCSSRVA